MAITDSHQFDLQIALRRSDVAKETVRTQREAGNWYKKKKTKGEKQNGKSKEYSFK